MTNSIFILALFVSISYILLKFLEMRLILKQKKPLKFLFRDGVIVYFSVFVGIFVVNKMIPLKGFSKPISVFTDNPDF